MKRLTALVFALLTSFNTWPDAMLGLPDLPVPADNPQLPEKIALGKKLFNDKRLSADNTVSCASCHREAKAFTDGLSVATGIRNQIGTRNTPTVINAAFYETLFLDGRAASLEAQALGPLTNPIEHGLPDAQTLAAIIQADASYRAEFERVFHVKAERIDSGHIGQAIAAYERTLIAGNSAFDRFLFASDKTALSASAQRGLAIFQDKGNCVVCHEISWNNALFTDNRFYNLGVSFKKLKPVLDQFIAHVNQGKNPDAFPLTATQRSELGRFSATKNLADIGKFKTPTLRNIALTAPYMHDGSMKTLEEVVEHYDKGGEENPYLDKKIFPLHLSRQDKADLVEFMQALTSNDGLNLNQRQ